MLVLLLQLLLAKAQSPSPTTPIVPAILVFGDSIVDTGNNNGLSTVFKSNFPPYGQDFRRHQATGRFCNGKITSDIIAATGYDPITVLTAAVISMPKQLEMFKEYKERLKTMVGEQRVADITANSLYVVCAGSNDVITYFNNPLRRLGYGIPEYAEFLIKIASGFVKDLVNLGAKKVAVLGIPPIGCIPSQRAVAGGKTKDCVADRNQLAQLYNSKLKELQSLTSRNQGTKLIYVDIYSPLLDIIQSPQKYGLKESTKGCCGEHGVEAAILCNSFSSVCPKASEYLFWDSYHTTQRGNEILVDQIIQKYIRFLT
ncbi:GDSL esterase/lipase EXL3 [Cocos nucifera]|uniref:GDSL esterase/lipase EXL3 n=1 Tax=Cocos nucifera TaxID=13894 RepID=A0A8K0IDR3_COCNU|nr:GDSL esterase/lipase EXL3 [Cocos nucifera]